VKLRVVHHQVRVVWLQLPRLPTTEPIHT
jgi:hypothetical protein